MSTEDVRGYTKEQEEQKDLENQYTLRSRQHYLSQELRNHVARWKDWKPR